MTQEQGTGVGYVCQQPQTGLFGEAKGQILFYSNSLTGFYIVQGAEGTDERGEGQEGVVKQRRGRRTEPNKEEKSERERAVNCSH